MLSTAGDVVFKDAGSGLVTYPTAEVRPIGAYRIIVTDTDWNASNIFKMRL